MFRKVMTPKGIRLVELIRPALPEHVGLGWRVHSNGEQWEEIKDGKLNVELVNFKMHEMISKMELIDGQLKEVHIW